MKNKQQIQTKIFFEKDALNWSKKSKFKKKLIYNAIHERNLYVINLIKKFKSKYHLDVGSGVGDLCFETAKKTKSSIGIDFSSNMIKIAENKFKRKNLRFFCKSFFDYVPESKFDCISANGFIEYLSINEIIKFFKLSNSYLKKNGILTFSSRNRIFNLFSLNDFSKKELSSNLFKDFYKEAILFSEIKQLNEIDKIKKRGIEKIKFKQPSTGIKVSVRHQFSPLQLIKTLKNLHFKLVDIHPINYHPVLPKEYEKDKEYKFFSNYIFKKTIHKNLDKLSFIPFASSFMITVKKI